MLMLVAMARTCLGEIQEWSGRVENTDYEVFDDVDIVILASGTFKFQSVTGGNLDDIGTITIDDSVTGTVTIHIARDPNDAARRALFARLGASGSRPPPSL
jgi:hypothetical protein